MGNGSERYRAAEQRLWDKAGVAATDRWLDLRGGERVRVQEVGSGPPILFVHGATNAGASWATLIGELSGFRCITLDRPGCGLSDPIVGAPLRDIEELERYADRLIVEVLDALDLPAAHLAVTSYGGYFGLRAAAAHPERIDRMVLYSWPLGCPMEKVPFSMRMAAVPGMQSLMTRMPITRRMLLTMFRQVGLERAIDTGTFDDDMIEWVLALLRDTDTFRNDIRSSPQVVRVFGGLSEGVLHSDELLSRVRAPSLFLWGDEDPNGGAVVASTFVERLPDARLEMIPRAGHAPWIDELALCADQTRDFLSA